MNKFLIGLSLKLLVEFFEIARNLYIFNYFRSFNTNYLTYRQSIRNRAKNNI